MNRFQCDSQTCKDQTDMMRDWSEDSDQCDACKCKCKCAEKEWHTNGCQTPGCNCYLAIANIPMQQWNGTYAVEKGFMRGTIFPELDLPFCGREVK